MSGGFLTRYSRKSIPPETRAAHYVESESRLTWTSLFFQEFPEGEIFLVGGTLRDILLGRSPEDIDLVIRHVEPEELEHWLLRHGAAEFVGRFGTFKFVPHGMGGSYPIDIALPRTEHIGPEHRGGRRDMDVKFDIRLPINEDLARRDFTINAMAYNLKNGRLEDPFLGLRDLHNGVINAVLIPEQRFEEDATRMLRALRFASQLKFAIEDHTWRAITANINLLNKTDVSSEGTHQYVVPRQAIGKEFLLGFVEHPVHTLHLWGQCGALHLFMPQLAELEQWIEHDDHSAFKKTAQVLQLLHKKSLLSSYRLAEPSPSLLVGALMSFLSRENPRASHDICVDLHFHQFPKEHKVHVNCETVFWFIKHLHLFEELDPATMRPSKFERLFLRHRGRELLALMHAVSIAEGKHSLARERIHTANRILRHMERRLAQEGVDGSLPRLISGRDIEALGIPPGPAFRDLLDQIRDAQWMQEVDNKEEARDLLRKLTARLE